MDAYQPLLWDHLEKLCAFGPRNPGSAGHAQARAYIREIAGRTADTWQEQEFEVETSDRETVTLYNIELNFKGTRDQPPILLGAHYDTRPYADEEIDSVLKSQPIIGANDGGSGTAVLLGLAQYLHDHPPARPVRIVFFDGEDYGVRFSSDYFLGSTHYADQLAGQDKTLWPHAVLVVDMVGDKDLRILKEVNSTKSAPGLVDTLFQKAGELGMDQFFPKYGYAVRDDHIPFAAIGIPSVLLIDMEYPHWHKLADTLDKCSAESLFAVFTVVAQSLPEIN
ncbi:MAG: M28 family peptidase [Nitrospina sp.]|nr:MAG: M28 family peptidase [Nitrospina sp.]